MKYIKSTTQKSYVVQGKVIPPCVTPRNQTLALDDSEWFQVSSQPVIAALIHSGDLLVLDEDPNTREDTEARSQVAELKAQNTQLEAKLKELQAAVKPSTEQEDWKAKYEELQKEAVEELQKLKEENEQLRASQTSKEKDDE